MRAFSFGVARLKHANFLRETRDDCRFSGVEAIFALKSPMFRANRKLSHNIDAVDKNSYNINAKINLHS